MPKITSRTMKQVHACKYHQELFEKTFPHGAFISYNNLKKANEAGMSTSSLFGRLSWWVMDHAVPSTVARAWHELNDLEEIADAEAMGETGNYLFTDFEKQKALICKHLPKMHVLANIILNEMEKPQYDPKELMF